MHGFDLNWIKTEEVFHFHENNCCNFIGITVAETVIPFLKNAGSGRTFVYKMVEYAVSGILHDITYKSLLGRAELKFSKLTT